MFSVSAVSTGLGLGLGMGFVGVGSVGNSLYRLVLSWASEVGSDGLGLVGVGVGVCVTVGGSAVVCSGVN